MVNVVRKPGKKVDFNYEKAVKLKPILNKEQEIKEKFLEIKEIEKIIRKIQSEIRKKGEEEKQINQKQAELQKLIGLWNDIDRTNLNKLEKGNIIKITNSQKNFIKDLLEHQRISIKNEKQYIQRIKKLKSK